MLPATYHSRAVPTPTLDDEGEAAVEKMTEKALPFL